MEPKRKVAKVPNKKKIDLIPYGYRGEGVPVSGLTPVDLRNISVIETSTNKDEERKKALESVFKLPNTSLTNILPPETDTEKNIVKEFVNSTPSVLTKKSIDPYTQEREPGSGPVGVEEEVKEKLDFSDDSLENTPIMDENDIDNEDFELMDIDDISYRRTDKEQDPTEGGKRRRRKMKTRRASRKSKRGKKHSSSRKTKSKRRRASVRRR